VSLCSSLLPLSFPPGVVDVCLIPEVPFKLEKLLEYVGEVLDKKGNAVVCVAEGAGQVRVRGASGVASVRRTRASKRFPYSSKRRQSVCNIRRTTLPSVLSMSECICWWCAAPSRLPNTNQTQDILAKGNTAKDASGNAILADVGLWMRDEFKKYFKVRQTVAGRQACGWVGGRAGRQEPGRQAGRHTYRMAG
jgi:hypothetical protein